MDPLLPPLPRCAVACDARAPAAWRTLAFLDGSGRGDVDDWLAVGGAPDASHAAPLLAKPYSLLDELIFLDGVRAVRFPRVGVWDLGRDWPAAWRDSGDAQGMAEAVARLCPGARAALAFGLVRASGIADLCPAAFDDAVAAIAERRESSVLDECSRRARMSSGFIAAAWAAQMAVMVARSDWLVAPGQANLAAEAAARARRHFAGTLTWNAHLANVAREIREALPWHDLLPHLVVAGDAAPWPTRRVERARCEPFWGRQRAVGGSASGAPRGRR